MKKHLFIALAIGLLGSTCFGCSSPPATAYNVIKKETINVYPATACAVELVQTTAAMPGAFQITTIPAYCTTVLSKTVSVTATSGHAIDQRLGAALNATDDAITLGTFPLHSDLHIDPGLIG